jgi:hypothetical protein
MQFRARHLQNGRTFGRFAMGSDMGSGMNNVPAARARHASIEAHFVLATPISLERNN